MGDETPPQSTALRAVEEFVAGSVAGFACKIVEYPFDTMKVLLQSQDKRATRILPTLQAVIRNHGFLGMYRGLSAPLVGSMVENAVLFAGYGIASNFLIQNNMFTQGLPHYALSGLGAGLVVSFVLTPIELVKCRIQMQNLAGNEQRYRGPVDCLVKVIKEEGLSRGLYRGNLAMVLREAPGNMAWFSTYYFLCNKLTKEGKTRDSLAWYHNAFAGGVSGMTYWTAFYPADTVKTLQQSLPQYQQQSFISVFRNVYKQSGIRGLYKVNYLLRISAANRGWGLTVSRAVPSNAVLFMTYELINKIIRPAPPSL
eukprot:gene4729-6826_t